MMDLQDCLPPLWLYLDHREIVHHIKMLSDVPDLRQINPETNDGLNLAWSVLHKKPLVFLVQNEHRKLELKNYRPRLRKELYRLWPDEIKTKSDFISKFRQMGRHYPFGWFVEDQCKSFLRDAKSAVATSDKRLDVETVILWLEGLRPRQFVLYRRRAEDWLNSEPSEEYDEIMVEDDLVPLNGYDYADELFRNGPGFRIASALGLSRRLPLKRGQRQWGPAVDSTKDFFENDSGPIVRFQVANTIAEEADLPIRFEQVYRDPL